MPSKPVSISCPSFSYWLLICFHAPSTVTSFLHKHCKLPTLPPTYKIALFWKRFKKSKVLLLHKVCWSWNPGLLLLHFTLNSTKTRYKWVMMVSHLSKISFKFYTNDKSTGTTSVVRKTCVWKVMILLFMLSLLIFYSLQHQSSFEH